MGMDLISSYHKVMLSLGMNDIQLPVFYSTPIGIRFAIGDCGDAVMYSEDGTVNESYIENCFYRASCVLDSLPTVPDILAVQLYFEDENTLSEDINAVLSVAGLPNPKETEKRKVYFDDGDHTNVAVLFWDLSSVELDRDRLLREIILSDIGGEHLLTASVFWICCENNVMFHLYDDRGADLVASKRETIRKIYNDLNGWILDYDRERIEETFKN